MGYLLKEASSVLRTSMEEALRPLGMTMTHDACLELLAQRPGLSNSELARGAFVTRQSMSVLLRSLEDAGEVRRAAGEAVGKTQPTRLTDLGRSRLATASRAVREVEDSMISTLSREDQDQARRALRAMVAALRATTGPAGPRA